MRVIEGQINERTNTDVISSAIQPDTIRVNTPAAFLTLPSIHRNEFRGNLAALQGHLPVTLPLQYTAQSSESGVSAVSTRTINFVVIDSGQAVAKSVLPSAAQAIAESAVAAVAERVEVIRGGGDSNNNFTIGGTDSIAAFLKTNGASITHDEWDSKQLLQGMSGAMGFSGGSVFSNPVVWVKGAYSETDGDSDGISYASKTTGFYLGADANITTKLALGLSVSDLSSDIEYRSENDAGDYDVEITSVSAYASWGGEYVDLWATVGYGEGDADAKSDVSPAVSSDISIEMAGAGVSVGVFDNRFGELRAKGDVVHSKVGIEGKTTALG